MREWSAAKAFQDGDMVYGSKLALFLQERVINRTCKKGRNSGKKLGKSSIKNYVSAITNLWMSQRGQDINPHLENPRSCPAVSTLMKNRQLEEHRRDREDHVDRGRHGL